MLVNGDLSRGQSGSSDKLQGGVASRMISNDEFKKNDKFRVTDPTSFLASHRKGFSKL